MYYIPGHSGTAKHYPTLIPSNITSRKKEGIYIRTVVKRRRVFFPLDNLAYIKRRKKNDEVLPSADILFFFASVFSLIVFYEQRVSAPQGGGRIMLPVCVGWACKG